MAGRHRRHAWRRHRRGEVARDRSRSRLRGVTDAGTLVGHLMTGEAAPGVPGRYVAVCGARVLPVEPVANLKTVPEHRFRPVCLRAGGAP